MRADSVRMDLWTFCEMGCQLRAYGCSFAQLGEFLLIYYLLILTGLPKDWFSGSLICKYTTIYLFSKGPHDLWHQDKFIQSPRLPILTAFLSLLYRRSFSILFTHFLLLKIKNDLSIQSSSMPRLCTVLFWTWAGTARYLRGSCAVPARVIKNCFLVRLKHRAKKGIFTWNGAVFSTKTYCLNTKMHTKGCFGHNRKYFCGDFSTLTRKLTKDGYLSQSKKPFFIQFFGKTKAFT